MDYNKCKSSTELKKALVKAKRKSSSGRKGYTLEEMDKRMKKYIAESAERLRKRFQAAWKKNAKLRRDQYSNR